MGRLVLALLLLCASSGIAARTFTVEDLIRMESYGQVISAPQAGLLLIERRLPYDRADDYGHGGYFNDRSLGRIMAATPTALHAGLRTLFPQETGAGYWMGTLSPSGTRLTVFRLKAGVLSLGVVELRDGRVVWLGVRPDLLARDPAPVWLDERRLLVAETPSSDLPRILRIGSAANARNAALAADQARGGPSWTTVSTRTGGAVRQGGLVELRVDGTGRRQVFRGEITDFSVAPDASAVAVVSAGAPVMPPASPIGVSFVSRRHRLDVVSLGEARSVGGFEDVAPNLLAWSTDGRLLVIIRDAAARDWSASSYLTLSTSGRMTRLGGSVDVAYVPEPADVLRIRAYWAGSSLAALVRRGGGSEWRLLAKGRSKPLPLPSTATVVAHDPSSILFGNGEERWMLEGARLTRLPAGTHAILARSLEPFSSGDRMEGGPCGSVMIVTGRNYAEGPCPSDVPLRPGDEVVAGLGSGLVIHRTDERGVETIAIVDRAGRRSEVDRINAALFDVDLPRAVPLRTSGPDGTTLVHWLLLPAGPVPVTRLVVEPYPGRVFGSDAPVEARPWRHGFGTNALLLTGAGVAVLLPSMPRRAGVNPVDDVVPQVEAAVAAAHRTGLVAADRYGVMGHSFGAWAAMVIAERGRCLAGVVAANGTYDMTAAHAMMEGPDRIDLEQGIPFGSSTGWTEAGQGSMGALPAAAALRYAAASPVLHAATVTTPVLIVAGEIDPVGLTQSERMFMEIGRHGGDATLLRFWGEGHTVSSPGNLRRYWTAATTFLADQANGTVHSPPCSASSPSTHRPDVDAGRAAGQAQAANHASQLETNISER